MKLYKILRSVLSSKWFLVGIIGLFVLQASWIAISARYPMAFDEKYHVEIIKIHANQISPIITHQPNGPATYGALTRDPSYMFHYLMSLPYRLLINAGVEFMTVIIILRLMNVAFFSAGIILFYILLRRLGVTRAVSNLSLLFFILIPVVPLIAAHINYDNLQFPLIAFALLLTIEAAQAYKQKHTVNVTKLILLLTVCTFASLVKFTFLPIFAGIVVYGLYAIFRYRVRRKGTPSFFERLSKSWRVLSLKRRILLASVVAVGLSLFMYTYAINMAVYKNPIPQCGQVLSVERCMTYGPWARNYLFAQAKLGSVNPNPIPYTLTWLGGMQYRMFFVINGTGPTAKYENHTAPLPIIAATLFTIIGLVLALRYSKRLLEDYPLFSPVLFISLVYVGAVWGRNYHDYLQLGQAVAINGRYLVMVLLPFIAFGTLSYQKALAGKPQISVAILVIMALAFLPGGGAISFLHYSNRNWYQPNPSVRTVNESLQKGTNLLFLQPEKGVAE